MSTPDASLGDARRPGSARLRTVVLATDSAALGAGWGAALAGMGAFGVQVASREAWTGLLAALLVGMLALRAIGAHERRIARVRYRELTATTRAAFAPAAMVGLLLPQDTVSATLLLVGLTAAAWALLLAAGRAALREWIRGHRARGHLQAPVLVVGTGRALDVTRFLDSHPHLGFRVVDSIDLLPEDPQDAVALVSELTRTTGASGIVVSDPGDPVVRPLLAALCRSGLHVHVATGVRGLDQGGAVTSSLAGELFLDFSPRRTPALERAIIRAMDVTLAGIGLLLTLPVSLAVAAAIRLTDGGPVLYVQQRVGRDEQPFPMLKFRSMREGADRADLSGERNGREGPLTKVVDDPRTTTVGRLIRATSLDELPQLLNVLRGEMSVVGPRPALASEHEEFDAELRRRTEVRPGLTGLWQVEGRDLPSFELYRRLDLLYVDNLSVGLYVSVLLRTVTALTGHTLRSLLGSSEATLEPEAMAAHDDLDTVIDVTDRTNARLDSREGDASRATAAAD